MITINVSFLYCFPGYLLPVFSPTFRATVGLNADI